MTSRTSKGRLRFPKGKDTRPGTRLVVLGIGSNHDADEQIRRAIDEISYLYQVLVRSTRYVGPPEGAPDETRDEEAPYSNACVLIRTADTYGELYGTLREIESELGRNRSTPEVVAVDIDILLIDGEVVREQDGSVTVPHRDLDTKRHAAIPGSEVAPGLIHPVTRETIGDIAARLA